jgi:putative membrane protein
MPMNEPTDSSPASLNKKAPLSKKASPRKKAPPRKEGRSFAPSAKESVNDGKARQGKTFTPEENENLTDVPESITAGERLPHVSEYSGLKLEALPVKGLKSFFYSIAAVLIAILSWELYKLVVFVLEQHWLLASLLGVLVGIVVVLSFRLVINFLTNKEGERALENIRTLASELKLSSGINDSQHFIRELSAFYADKPHAIHYQRCIDSLPDYANDREVLAHIDVVFLQPLDREALRRVSRYSAQTGVVVAASPWAIVDIVLVLWRSIKMIDDVAQTYGMRPSRLNRLKLLKKVIHQLAFIAVSEVVLDELLEQMGAVTIVGIASTRIAQGLGASVYTAKIGLAAMQVSRPCELSENQTNLSSILPPIVSNLKSLLAKGKTQ